ncbi:hypothetical protein V8G54_013288 [Vigna mungo]|uniref:Uncharacterized protein n=1 Tax=Vigna mungo TaxID=3915 RepID=A0AAQ3S347_VIGMU
MNDKAFESLGKKDIGFYQLYYLERSGTLASGDDIVKGGSAEAERNKLIFFVLFEDFTFRPQIRPEPESSLPTIVNGSCRPYSISETSPRLISKPLLEKAAEREENVKIPSPRQIEVNSVSGIDSWSLYTLRIVQSGFKDCRKWDILLQIFVCTTYILVRGLERCFIFLTWRGIWDATLNGPFEPTHIVDGKTILKNFSEWSQEENRQAQYDVKARNIIASALTIDEFFRISQCKSAKEMWDILEVIHEGTDEVKRARKNSLIQEYELFRMMADETIYEVQKSCVVNVYVL